MKFANLTKTLKGKTGWVSISSDNKKIIAYSKTFKNLIEKLKKMGYPKGSISPIPKDYSNYVGYEEKSITNADKSLV